MKYLVTEDEFKSATVTEDGDLEFTRDNGVKVVAGRVRGADSTVPGPPGKDGSNVLPTQAAILQEITEDGPVKDQLSATIGVEVGPLVAAAIADDETIVQAAADAVEAIVPDAVEQEIAGSPAIGSLQDTVFGEDGPVPMTDYEVVDLDANYKNIRPVGGTVLLQKGVKYLLELVPSVSFALSGDLQMGTGFNSASMVDTLAPAGTLLTEHQPFQVEYTPAVEGIRALRILGNVSNVPTVNVYMFARKGGLVDEVGAESPQAETDKHYIANKLNRSIAELRALKNDVDTSLSSLTQVQAAEGITKSFTVDSVQGRLLRVGMHYGASRYTPSDTELFFDGESRTDFTDVRFLDANGNMLRAQLGEPVNMDLLEDTKLNQLVKVSASGMLVGFDNGVTLSADNGETWELISGTRDVTTNVSPVYNRKSMYPIYIDAEENIFAYAGGILYKMLAADSYATKTPVLDFSWTPSGGSKVYPDVQNHAMDADSNGVLFMSPYQEQFRTVIYRSTDGGDTWEACWTGDDSKHQHVHHIHADKFSNKVYFGVDDGGTTFNGAHILVTEDGGDTWIDITDDNHAIRGRDYYPTYFGEDYRLGGGESYYNGGATIIRSEDDETYTTPVKGIGGVRSYADFGDDDVILAGVQHCKGNTANQILASYDQGKSWKALYTKWQAPQLSSGQGFRDNHDAVLIQGDTEPCIIMGKDTANVRPMRVYRGEDHYYREAFIELPEGATGPVTITAKTGYMMGYPYKTLNDAEVPGLVYRVPLNEGAGRLVADSECNVVRIDGADYEWETSEEPVRYGDYSGVNVPKPFIPSSGLLLRQGTTLNFGKIDALDFSGGYTITFWINPKAFLMEQEEYDAMPSNKGILSVGNITLFQRHIRFGYQQRSNSSVRRMRRMGIDGYGWSDQYFHVAFVVNADASMLAYLNGTEYGYAEQTFGMAGFTPSLLSESDFVLGTSVLPSAGYLSDVKVYNRVIGADEVLRMYRGV